MLKVIGVTLCYYVVLQLAAAVIMFFSGFNFVFPYEGDRNLSGYHLIYTALQLVIVVTCFIFWCDEMEYRRRY